VSRLDQVTFVAERGFSAEEVQALGRVRDMRFGDGNVMRFMMVGLGSVRSRPRAMPWAMFRPFRAKKNETLAGKNEACEPLREHRPAFYLPADADGNGRLFLPEARG
jgi:hypothetical protein